MCESWNQNIYGASGSILECAKSLPAVLKFYGMTLEELPQLVWTSNVLSKKGFVFPLWGFLILFNAFLLLGASIGAVRDIFEETVPRSLYLKQADEEKAIEIAGLICAKYFLIPFLASLVMYVLTIDWGRWFFITGVSYVLCFLSPGLIQLETWVQRHGNKRARTIPPSYLAAFKKFHRQYLSLLRTRRSVPLMIFALFFQRLPHYDMRVDYLYNGIAYKLKYVFILLEQLF
jgi:hypothetical protein